MWLPHKFCHSVLGMVVSCLNVNKTKFRPFEDRLISEHLCFLVQKPSGEFDVILDD